MIHLRSPIAIAFVILSVLVTLAGFVLIPSGADLPVRWGLTGEATATMTRNWALLQMPIATAIVWGLFYLVGTSGTAHRRASTATVLRFGLPILTALFALIQLVIVLIGLGVRVPFLHVA
jgi:hypothetical protein